MSRFFEHQKSSFKRNYLRNLIMLASADGDLKEEERDLIHKIGIRRGLKRWQIEELFLENRATDLFLPESIANRMNMLYDLMEMMYVDRQASEGEIAVVAQLLEAFQLEPSLLNSLLHLFRHGTPEPLDWRDFVDEVCLVPAA